MQFSRIKLENWRNFSISEADLQTRAFIVGANASGKSNFLDVFRFLRDLVTLGVVFKKLSIDGLVYPLFVIWAHVVIQMWRLRLI